MGIGVHHRRPYNHLTLRRLLELNRTPTFSFDRLEHTKPPEIQSPDRSKPVVEQYQQQ